MKKHLLLGTLLAILFSCAKPEAAQIETPTTITSNDSLTTSTSVSGTASGDNKKLSNNPQEKITKDYQVNAGTGLQGKWVHEDDSLAYLEISGPSWIMGYEGQEITQNDKFTYTIVDKLPQFAAPEVKAEFIILENKIDTMYYEINGLTEETLSLTYIPRMNIHVYKRKK